MKKIFTILVFLFSFCITYAGGGIEYNEPTYGIVIGEVGEIYKTILQKEQFHPLREDKETVTFYNYELKNPEYISSGNIVDFQDKQKINIVKSSEGLGYYKGGFEEPVKLPKVGSKVIYNYMLDYNQQIQDNSHTGIWKKELEDVAKVLYDNNIYLDGYINTQRGYTYVISCDTDVEELTGDILRRFIIIPQKLDKFTDTPYTSDQNIAMRLRLQKNYFRLKVLSKLNCFPVGLRDMNLNINGKTYTAEEFRVKFNKILFQKMPGKDSIDNKIKYYKKLDRILTKYIEDYNLIPERKKLFQDILYMVRFSYREYTFFKGYQEWENLYYLDN